MLVGVLIIIAAVIVLLIWGVRSLTMGEKRARVLARFPCDVCGHRTLDRKAAWEICPVCFWEDDEWYTGGGANDVTLEQARTNYGLFGAAEQRCVKSVRKPTATEIETR